MIPKRVAKFLQKVSELEDQSIAARTAKQMLRKYVPATVSKKERKPKKHKSKKPKKKKLKQRKRRIHKKRKKHKKKKK